MSNGASYITSFCKVVGWRMGCETRKACLPSSAIESNALLKTKSLATRNATMSQDFLARVKEEVSAAEVALGHHSGGTAGKLPAEAVRANPIEATASLHETVPMLGVDEKEENEQKDEKDKKDATDAKLSLKLKKENLQTMTDTLKEKLRERKDRVAATSAARNKQMEQRTVAAVRLEESRAGVEKHKKMLGLLPEGEANLERLMGIVEKSKARLAGLQNQWEEHKKDKDVEYQKLQEGILMAEGIAARTGGRGRRPAVLEQLEWVGEQMEAAAQEHQRLLRLVEKVREGESRESHTERILAILKQLTKLQAGVDNVIGDVKLVQKDINLLNGRLERTFFESCITMKGRISNKEPYVEHSQILLR